MGGNKTITTWIRGRFKMRKCTRFIEDKSPEAREQRRALRAATFEQPQERPRLPAIEEEEDVQEDIVLLQETNDLELWRLADQTGAEEGSGDEDYSRIPVVEEQITATETAEETFGKTNIFKFLKSKTSSHGSLSSIAGADATTICMCGHLQQEHEFEAIKKQGEVSNTTWNTEDHTKTYSSVAFGEIAFLRGKSVTGNLTKYACLDHKTFPSILIHFIYNLWKLDTPKLLISIIGGDDVTKVRGVKKDFQVELVTAAGNTGAWLTVSGSGKGGDIIHIMGEAMQLAEKRLVSRIALIGFLSWGMVSVKEDLIDENLEDLVQGCWPATYTGASISPNYTHLVFVDNGTKLKEGSEREIRGKLERQLAKTEAAGFRYMTLPTISVLYGGDFEAFETIKRSLEESIPVVFISGSGGAADIFISAISKMGTDDDHLNMNEAAAYKKQDESLKNEVTESFSGLSEEAVEYVLEVIGTCCEEEYKHLLNVYSQDCFIEDALFKALIRSKRTKGEKTFRDKLDKFQLMLLFNRIEQAKEEFCLLMEAIVDGNLNQDTLAAFLHYALVHNTMDFVILLLRTTVNTSDDVEKMLDSYLTHEELESLYLETRNNRYIIKMMETIVTDEPTVMWIIDVVQRLSLDTYRPAYDTRTQQNPNQGLCPVRDLFLFAVLLSREEMSMFFWELLDEPLAGAIMASYILESLAIIDFEKRAALKDHARVYRKLAMDYLTECFANDRERTFLSLCRLLNNWGGINCLVLVRHAEDIVAHEAVQEMMKRLWLGHLLKDNAFWRITSGLCCVFLIRKVVNFREEDAEKIRMVLMKETKKEEKKTTKVGTFTRSRSFRLSAVTSTVTDIQWREKITKNVSYSGWRKVKLFYQSPMIKFKLHMVSYFLFLLLFSYICLVNHSVPTWEEFVLIIWVLTLIIEEIRQIIQSESLQLRNRPLDWISGTWNKVDFLSLFLFLLAMILRFIEQTVTIARVILAIDLMIFYLRLFENFAFNRNLGPQLIMIAKMTGDLFFFVCIMFVFLTAYAVSSFAVIHPFYDDPWTVIKGILYQAYLQLVESDSDFYEEAFNCSNLVGGESCLNHLVGLALTVFYIVLFSVLLLNLLIAIFTFSITQIQENIDLVWKNQRYDIIKEYYQKPMLPPPFIILPQLYRLFKYMCSAWKPRPMGAFDLNEDDTHRLIVWEREVVEDYLQKCQFERKQDLVVRVDAAVDSIKKVDEKMDTRMISVEKKLSSLSDKLDLLLENVCPDAKPVKQSVGRRDKKQTTIK